MTIAAAPGSHISTLVTFLPSCHQSEQMSGVHMGCLEETRHKLGIRGCSGATGRTGFDLQETLGHTPIMPWLLCSPTVVTCFERHILICFKNYL